MTADGDVGTQVTVTWQAGKRERTITHTGWEYKTRLYG